jgi:DNA adenine methylase
MSYVTPLRYPGGKSKLAKLMERLLESNNLVGGHYAEAYCGGASLALHLLLHDYAAHIHLNDLSRSIYAFWKSVLEDTDNLCRLINDTPVTIESWDQQRKIQENPSEHTSLELGFSTFFLNRTNRSGIITGGVIGGKKQEGNWLINARYNKPTLIIRIRKVAQNKNRITLHNLDAKQFIINIIPDLPARSLIYFDPPYYSKGRRLYKNYYQHDDHVAIADYIKELEHNWVVSYDNQPEIRKLYERYRNLTYKLSYSANQHYEGSEIIFFCSRLIVPSMKDLAEINKGNYLLDQSLDQPTIPIPEV